MEQKRSEPFDAAPVRKWLNRILAASLFGVSFFTLFPYWINFGHSHYGLRSPFLLGGPLRFDGILHTLLNVLLFVPFGFAVSQFFGRFRKSYLISLFLAGLSGAVLSYAIEFLQVYMPIRDSAWDDVLANTFGALVGAIVGLIAGVLILRELSGWERRLEKVLSLKMIAIAALIYFSVWIAISIPLQQKSHLSNWDPNSYIIVGDDLTDDSRWSGVVSRLQIWDHALPASQAIEVSKNEGLNEKLNGNSIGTVDRETISSLVASYDITRATPVANKHGSLPSLVLMPPPSSKFPSFELQRPLHQDALRSEQAVPSLITAVTQSNQFAVHVVCVPGLGNDTDGEILAVANLSGKYSFFMHQSHSNLFISFQNGLDSAGWNLAWRVSDIFTPNVIRSIVFSYDGATASLFIDGEKRPESYPLSPGAALVKKFRLVKADVLEPCFVLYESLVFLPLGFLLGFAIRIMPRRNAFYSLAICIAILLPAMLLEWLLVWISGRQPSITQLSWSIGLTIAAMLWMNLDAPVVITRSSQGLS